MWKQKGKRPAQLDGPELPPILAYLWQWFLELNNARQETDSKVLPLTFQEIESWKNLMDYDVTPFDVRVLKQLDTIALEK